MRAHLPPGPLGKRAGGASPCTPPFLRPRPLSPPPSPGRFLHGSDEQRTAMLKLIPHIPNASWVIKQSVGTVPVILGTKLKTSFYRTDR